MALRSGDRSPRAGAHRAPRTAPLAREPQVKKAGEGNSTSKVVRVARHSRSKMIRRGAAVVVVGGIVAGGMARGGAGSAEPTVYQFLLDWQEGNYQGAAALTTGQQANVADQLRLAYVQLNATDLVLGMQQVSQQGNTAQAWFKASINLGAGVEWTYTGYFVLRGTGSTWRVVWSPSVIVPGLHAGERLAIFQQPSARAWPVAAGGQALTVKSLTYQVGVVPSHLRGPAEVQQIAQGLAPILKLQQADTIAGEIEASTSPFRELITMAPGQYAQYRRALARIPGLEVRRKMQRLFTSIAPDVVGSVGTETAKVLSQDGVPYRPGATVGLSGLQLAFQRQLTGTPTIAVVIENAQGVALVSKKTWSGVVGKAVTTTLDYGVQQAANSALAQVPYSGAIVAVQARTGKILAVASRQARGMPALDPLAGQYAPGQAFTIVSSAALLGPGGVTPATTFFCSPSNLNFTNDPVVSGMGGTAKPFSKIFAVGCSTAFVGLSESLTAADLSRAASEFGIGARWQLPVSRFSGTIGQPSGHSQLAADFIGQGDVRVSPLSMALAAATADVGHWHAPSLVTGEPDPSVTVKDTMTTQVLTELQGLMHGAALHAAGTAANIGSDVYGQAGNAPFGARGKFRIAWFVGYQGSVAFAVAEIVPSASGSAAWLAGSFLQNTRTGY